MSDRLSTRDWLRLAACGSRMGERLRAVKLQHKRRPRPMHAEEIATLEILIRFVVDPALDVTHKMPPESLERLEVLVAQLVALPEPGTIPLPGGRIIRDR